LTNYDEHTITHSQEVSAMKAALPLCLACLLTLTSCGGHAAALQPETSSPPPEASFPPFTVPLTAEHIQPTEYAVDSGQLPTELSTDPAVLSAHGIHLLAQLPEKDISLYGLWDETGAEGLLLDLGGDLAFYEQYWLTPRCVPPELYSGDYDGDGTDELAILTYTGSGTGVSAWTLTVFEKDGGSLRSLTLPDMSYSTDVSPLLSCEHTELGKALLTLGDADLPIQLEDYADPQAPLEPYVGTCVSYEVSGDAIRLRLLVGLYQEDFIPYTLYYPAVLEGQVAYDGEGFTLMSPALTDQ